MSAYFHLKIEKKFIKFLKEFELLSQKVNSPLDETVEPKLNTESWFEFKLAMEPRLEPPCLWLLSSPGLCLPPGLRSTLSSLGGGARRLGATAATGAE